MKFAFPLFFFLLIAARAQSQQPRLIWVDQSAIAVAFDDQSRDQPDQWEVALEGRQQSMLGKWETKGRELRFFPVVPFTPGLKYQIKWNGQIAYDFLIPKPEREAPQIVDVYPTSQIIPANLLKIHIEFSQPMQEGQSMKYIHLINDLGDTIRDVFLDLQPELWNDDRTRLTLWLDPGRIKRDLQPNLKMGPPLIAGSEYRIVVSKTWRDQFGLALTSDFVRSYLVGAEDRQRPVVGQWELKYPVIHSKDALMIDFKETIDYELALHALHVYKYDTLVKGDIILDEGESKWQLVPDKPWTKGTYQVVVEHRLEDLAGNNLNRLFDMDLNHGSGKSKAQDQVIIPFTLPANVAQ